MAKVWVPAFVKADGTRVKGYWRQNKGKSMDSTKGTMSNEKTWYKVKSVSRDNVPREGMYMGKNPSEALQRAKKENPALKGFKVGKTAFNTFGERIKSKRK